MTEKIKKKFSLITFDYEKHVLHVMHIEAQHEKELVDFFRQNNQMVECFRQKDLILNSHYIVFGFRVHAIDDKPVRHKNRHNVYIGKLSSVTEYVAEQATKNSKPYAVTSKTDEQAFQPHPPHLSHYNPKYVVTFRRYAELVVIQPWPHARVYDEETGGIALRQSRSFSRPPIVKAFRPVVH